MSPRLLVLLAFCLAACGDGTSTPDAGGMDAATPRARLCSVPLPPPCDDAPLTSAATCLSSLPYQGMRCAMPVDDACYYCSGEESAWPTQDTRTMAYCDRGIWAHELVVCGVGP